MPNALDTFLLDAICDSVNGAGHRFVEFVDSRHGEVTACADCGVVDE